MTTTSDLHALAKTRSECAERLEIVKGRGDQGEIAEAQERYQQAEDSYQRAIGTLTNFELINMGLAP